jgi:hypothetical protein
LPQFTQKITSTLKRTLTICGRTFFCTLQPRDETDIDVNSTTSCQGVQLKWSTMMPEKFPPSPRFSQTNVDLYKSIQHGPTITQRGIKCIRIQRQSHPPRRKTPSGNKHPPLATLRNRIPSQQRNSRRSKRRRKTIRCCLS